MNGPDTLSLNESLAIAKAWKDAKDRRRVNDSVNIAEVVSHSEDDLIEDENAPDGDFDDLVNSDSFCL